jgi:hypothetical protein
MKKTLFLALSAAIVIFSIISICCAPIINGILTESSSWKTDNCKLESDEYKNLKKTSGTTDADLKEQKKKLNRCNRHKAMYGLEYSSLILDVTLGSICAILGLLHYFDVAKPFEKITGIIGLATGVIGFVLTLVYVCYSGYIFTKETAPATYESELVISSNSQIIKLNGDVAFAKKDGSGFKCLYYKKDKTNSVLAKYSDLGKKQYNYEKKRHYPKDNDEFNKADCQIDPDTAYDGCSISEHYSETLSPTAINNCNYLYLDKKANGFGNKYLFDRWVTTIIFSCFIMACCIGLAIFGFLLFKSDGSGL